VPSGWRASARAAISDCGVVASTAGKIGSRSWATRPARTRVVEQARGGACHRLHRHFALSELAPLLERLEDGPRRRSASWSHRARTPPLGAAWELRAAIGRLDAGESPAGLASATEFVLEGLHLNRRLNKDRRGGGTRYARG